MTTTYSLAGLFDALNQCREPDFVLLGVIADALEEAGDWRADGYRWAVEYRKFCGFKISTEDGMPYFWMFPFRTGEKKLSQSLNIDLARHWSNYGWYSTITAAFDDLCSMLKKRDAAQPQDRNTG